MIAVVFLGPGILIGILGFWLGLTETVVIQAVLQLVIALVQLWMLSGYRIEVSPEAIFGPSSLGHSERTSLTELSGERKQSWDGDRYPLKDGTLLLVSGLHYSRRTRAEIHRAILGRRVVLNAQ